MLPLLMRYSWLKKNSFEGKSRRPVPSVPGRTNDDIDVSDIFESLKTINNKVQSIVHDIGAVRRKLHNMASILSLLVLARLG